jgi:ABC-2 type transport system permease protein
MRLKWALVDGVTMTRRDLLHWPRQPAQLAVGLLFPVLTVLMFAYLLGGGMTVPGGGSYKEFLLPGMYAMTMVFGLEATFAAIATDAGRGVTDRLRSMPMAGSAVVSGRAAADLLHATVGLAVTVACGLAIGWRFHRGVGAALAAVGLLLLLRFALSWVGIWLGLVSRNPELLVAVQILVWPLGFVSNVFAAPATMPGWLAAIAEWNPVSATVAATRELFGNPGWGGESWIAQHSLLMAVVWPVLLIAVFFPLAVRRYRSLDA